MNDHSPSLAAAAAAPPYVEVCFRPNVQMISSARRFIAALYEPLLGDGDAASRAAMVAHELLENALKYSIDGHTVIRIELSRARPPLQLVVETRSRILPERRQGLDEAFAAMAAAVDADDHYQSAIHRARTLESGSGLGLARIWAEGEMKLEHSYDGDEVRIAATALIPAVGS